MTYPRIPSKQEVCEDIRSIRRTQGSISRKLYRKFGEYSERQIKNMFGSWGKALDESGVYTLAFNKPNPELTTSTSTSTNTETSELVGNKWNLTVPNTRIDTLEKLIAHFKVDLSIWKVERFIANKWEVGAKNAAGNIVVEPLYQVKATFVKQPDIEAAKKEIEALKVEGKQFSSKPLLAIPRLHTGSGNLLEINIPDAHFGKLAWGKETGDLNYDTTIAEYTYLGALETLLSRVSHLTFDKVLFVVGNDLLNSDDTEGRTTKGTFVSTDARYQKTFAVVRRTITRCIERLRQVAPVNVVMVSGNHDDLSVWHLGDSLECYFYKYDDITIDNAPTMRKYYRHGDVFLMFTHGDKGKRADYPLLMAREKSKDFGETRFREIHTGHIHQTKTEEFHGIRVRILPALCPPDAWHSENGFIGQQRNAEAFVWNDKEGLITQVFHNDEAYTPIQTQTIVL